MKTVAIVLAGNNTQSQVIVDGLDVSDMCEGVEIEAHIGAPTRVTLFMIADCRLMLDVPEVNVERPEDR